VQLWDPPPLLSLWKKIAKKQTALSQSPKRSRASDGIRPFSDQNPPEKSGGNSRTGILVFLINSTGTFPANNRAKTFLPVNPNTISVTSRSVAVFNTARAMSSLNISSVCTVICFSCNFSPQQGDRRFARRLVPARAFVRRSAGHMNDQHFRRESLGQIGKRVQYLLSCPGAANCNENPTHTFLQLSKRMFVQPGCFKNAL
jgi:hypothetical protein